MIDSIIITNLSEAKHVPFKIDLLQTAWISLSDPEDEATIKKLKTRFVNARVKHFSQLFRDWSDEDTETYIQDRLHIEGPQERHVNNIISFLEPLVSSDTHHHLGINCYAGISRSTAVGIIAWVMQGKSVEEALQYILKVRPVAWPNLRVLKLASARLGKNIMTAVSDWKVKESEKGIIIPHEL
jgi:predicted protein tyrosine phosphatase